MTKLKISFTQTPPAASGLAATVIGVQAQAKVPKIAKSHLDSKLTASFNLTSLGVSSEVGSLKKLSGPGSSVIALLGLGETIKLDSIRDAMGSAARELGNFEHVVIDLPLNSKEQVLAAIEGFQLGNYDYLTYKPKATKRVLAKLTIITSYKPATSALSELEVLTSAVHRTRDMVNAPANDLYPEVMVQAAKKLAKGVTVKVKVWEEKDLIADGLGGIHAVGKGSNRPPRLVKLEYKPARAKTSVAFVGKGITFDTGGLSLKPAESMVGMKYDMTGAASCLQALIAIAELKLPIKATAWLCLAENMPSGGATRPNDVIKIRNGKTVEVLNTDAEGRLVLADGLSMASEESPDYIVDVATLTGAATIALGNRYAGLMGDDKAIKKVQNAAATTGELVWHMPLPDELRPLLNSDIADIANVKIGNRAGGMLIGGLFLKEFVGTEGKSAPAWAHLDIAGPANNDSAAYGHTPKGATGVTVRTLVQLARDLAG
ncbi:MAG: leucyl aminopeptidase [Actinobacteria bacterium]|nr:leucyl aminopeptidase [Actinomycetota bacterium]MSZ17398.1 leucyl aminopeptidase [Actinomycetota bacterium]